MERGFRSNVQRTRLRQTTLLMAQRHLTKKEAINLGSFYTPKRLVDIAYSLLDKANAVTATRI